MPRLTVQGSSTGYNNEYVFDWEEVRRISFAQESDVEIVVPIGKMDAGDFVTVVALFKDAVADEYASVSIGIGSNSVLFIDDASLEDSGASINTGETFLVGEDGGLVQGGYVSGSSDAILMTINGNLRDLTRGRWRIKWLQHYANS